MTDQELDTAMGAREWGREMKEEKSMETDKASWLPQAVKAIKEAILKAQGTALRDVNRTQLSLYFGIGRYVSENSRKGAWGTGAVAAISERLQKEMPGLRGFGERNLKNMRAFFEFWSPLLDRQPLAAGTESTAITPLLANRQPPAADFDLEAFFSVGFSHHVEIMAKAKTLEECFYYIDAAKRGGWSKLELRAHLKADDFHHAGKLPNNFARTIPAAGLAAAAVATFKDEYMLDFVNVEDIDATSREDVDERVLEHSIVANIKNFIMAFGRDFSFVGNQFRMEIEGRELFVDLLFFNRELNALVAVELKRGEFKAAYLGQLHLYLQVLEDQYRKPHENPPIGIILCKSADKAFVEYAVRDYDKPMGVAVYRTADEMPERLRRALPPIDDLRRHLEIREGS